MKIRRNFAAVNAAVDTEKKKAYEVFRFRRARSLDLYGKGLLKIAGAVAILILAAAIAWWLITDEGDTVINNAYHTIDLPTQQALVRLADGTTAPVAEGSIDTRFTVFYTVDRGGAEVVTGWNYLPTDLEQPVGQYCYWASGTGDFSSRRVDLGQMDAGGDIVWFPVSDEYTRFSSDCYFGFAGN